METKLSKMRVRWRPATRRGAARRIVARFPRLGAEKEIITRGWSAHRNPDFYRSPGYDPDELVRTAITSIREKYGI